MINSYFETHCQRCHRFYYTNTTRKGCPYCKQARIEKNIYWVAVAIATAIAFLVYLTI